MAAGAIAKEVGVAYLLDGSVRASGSRLRIAARLIRAGDGFIVWSNAYDRGPEDRVKVQDDIAADVVKALEAGPLRPR